MANTPIPSLPIATSLDGTEQLELVQPPGSGGTSKRATAGQIAGLAAGLPTSSLPALSVFGNPTLIGQVGTAIVGTAGQVLVVNDAGSAVNFGRVNLSNTASITGSLNITAFLTGTLTVIHGGTSTTGFVANGVVVGNGTAGLLATAVGTNGQIFLGLANAAPSFNTMSGDATIATNGVITIGSNAVTFDKFQTMTGLSVLGVTGTARATGTSIIGTAGQVLVVNDAGSAVNFGRVNLSNTASITGTLNLTSFVTGTLAVTMGGTSTTGFFQNGVIVGNGTGGLLATAEGANGQVLLGFSNAAPTWQTMTGAATINTLGVLAIAANTVTFDKIQTMTGLSVFGVTGTARATGTSIIGTASQVLIVNDGGTSLGFGRVNLTAAAVTGTLAVNLGGSGTTGFVANGVVVGNGTAGLLATAVGTNGQILTGQAGAAPQWATVGGDFTIDNAGTGTIGTNKVTFAKFQTMTGLSVFGVVGTATANGTAIIGTASQVLIVNDGGTSLGFGRVNLTAAAVTGTLSVNLGGTSTTGFTSHGVLIGNGTAGIGATAEGANGQVFLGFSSAAPTWQTMTGDATINTAGALTLAANAVTFSKFQTMTGLSVVGVAGTATANGTAIIGTTDQVLRINTGGTGVSFGAINLATTAAVTGQLVAASFPALTGDANSSGGTLTTLVTSVTGTTTINGAAAGKVGETISATVLSASAVSLSSLTVANITSIAVTAGDWDLSGTAYFKGDTTTVVQQAYGGVSTTSGSITIVAPFFTSVDGGATTPFNRVSQICCPLSPFRISISTTTTYYLVADVQFSVANCSAFGFIQTRRSC